MLKSGMSIKLAYKKEGVNSDDIDWQEIGMDNESIAKKMLIRPKINMYAPWQSASLPVVRKNLSPQMETEWQHSCETTSPVRRPHVANPHEHPQVWEIGAGRP